MFSKMNSVGIEVKPKPQATVQNIVSSADLGCLLNLNSVCIAFGLENVEYEPEQFPGLVLRLDPPKVAVLLFGSGKMVITGSKTPKTPKTPSPALSGN
ncbi:putative TATA-box-binding protein [Methanocella paludicola SANAE]|uniref:TATA-box-binding protein n=2 Tax=Methanocella TaxID=570266 RepID=D1YY35_METPS|nr:putative TATA-box-binding protein [Methanocella paludicola SANAE]